MVAEYLSSGSVFGIELSRTFIEGISQVPAGGKLICESGVFKIERGGITGPEPPRKTLSKFREAIPVIRSTLNESVAAAIRRHRTVGCLLSGGLDSCAIAATSLLLEPTLGHRTILLEVGGGLGTREEKFLRREFCDFTGRVSESVELDHQQDLCETVRRMNGVANFPVGCTFSGIFETIAYRASELGCTILLSGDGGDEIFGHSRYTLVDIELKDTRKFIEALAIRRLKNGPKVGYLTDLLGVVALRRLPNLFLDSFPAISNWIAGVASPSKPEIDSLAPLLGPFYDECLQFSSKLFFTLCEQVGKGWALSDYWHTWQALRVPSYEPQFEYMSSASPPLSMCAASPFMTITIFDANSALPVRERFGLGIGSTSKTLLRHSMADRLPPSIAFHRKIGSSDDYILNQTLRRQWDRVREFLTSESLRRVGIAPAPEALQADWLLQNKHVDWFRVMMLSTWLEELDRFRAKS
jgi:hypothetical protein